MDTGSPFAKAPDCGCSCHVVPGVKHIIACCAAPAASEDSVQHCGCLCHTTPGVSHVVACCEFPPYAGGNASGNVCDIFGNC